MVLYPKMIMEALATVMYAGTKKNLVASEMVADTPAVSAPKSEGEPWQVKVVLTFPRNTDPFLKSTVKAAEAAIKYHCGQDVQVTIETEFKTAPRPEVGQLLPGVKYVDVGNLNFNPDVIRYADVVWIQRNCISHPQYWSVVKNCKLAGVQMRYFSYASAEKCAEQLVEWDRK